MAAAKAKAAAREEATQRALVAKKEARLAQSLKNRQVID